MKRTTRITILATVMLGLVAVPFVGSAGAAPKPNPSLASFEGATIDLRGGWGDAKACTSNGTTTTCYRTEAEMDANTQASRVSSGVVIQATCSGTLRLYSGTSYTGSLLQLSTQQVYTNLSPYGFDNVTSSYKVGPCSSIFYDGANGSGSVYPGNTNANIQSPTMLGGWDNRISSIYIS